MAKIYIHGRIVEDFMLQSGSARVLKVCLSSPANVTVNFSSERGLFTITSSLTFTTSNYSTFQNLTITPVNSGGWTGASDFIIATATGFTSVRKKIYVLYTDQGKFLRNFNWFSNIHIESQQEITDMIQYIKDFNHNGAYTTNGTPDASTSSFSGTMHALDTSSLVGSSSVTKLDWNHVDPNADTWTHSTFYITASSPKSPRELIFVHDGHNFSGDSSPVLMINKSLARGFDVMYTSMPLCGSVHPLASHPASIATTGTAAHKEILSDGIDRVGYNGIEIFLFDKLRALNYVEDLGIYGGRIYQYGYSGGCIAVVYMHVVDSRITKSYAHRGWVPREWMQSPNVLTTHGDYESLGDADGTDTFCGPRRYAFGTAVSLWDLIILGNAAGRQLVFSANYADTEGSGGTWQDITFEKMQTVCSQFSGSFVRLMFSNLSQAAHAFYSDEIDDTLDLIEG